MNKSETIQVLTYLLTDFDVEITEAKLNVWHDQFALVPYVDCMRAARVVVAGKLFGPPKCHDLHAALETLHSHGISEEAAWGNLLKCAQSIGRYDKERALATLARLDPAIAEASEPLYLELCNSEQSQWPTIRAHFWRMLAAVRSKQKLDRLGTSANHLEHTAAKLTLDQVTNGAVLAIKDI